MYFQDSELSELSALLRKGRLGVFVGSGISRNAPLSDTGLECPSWDGLLRLIAKSVGREHSEEVKEILRECHDMGDAANLLSVASSLMRLQPAAHLEVLREIFLPIESCPHVIFSSLVHDLLVRLPWRLVITTNFDLLLETAVDQIFPARKAAVTVGFPKELPESSSAINIWKIHGCAREGSVVLTEEEFGALYASARFGELLKAFLSTNNLLFLGVGFRDPAMRRIFAELREVVSPSWPTKIWAFVEESEAERLSELAGGSVLIRTYKEDPRNRHVQLLRELVELTISSFPDLPLGCAFNRNRERSALARYVNNVAEGIPRGCLALVGDDTTDRHQFAEHWLRFECLVRKVDVVEVDAIAYSTPDLLAQRLSEIFGVRVRGRESASKVLREVARNSGGLLRPPCILRIFSRPEMWEILIEEFIVPILREQRRREARFGVVMEFDSDRDLREHASELFARRDVDSFEESVLRFGSFSRESISMFLRYNMPLPPEVVEHAQPLLERAIASPPRYFLDLLLGIYKAVSREAS